jgi:hypothetical protein
MAVKVFERLKMAVIFWLGRRLPSCKELTPWMSQSLEERLPWRRQGILKLHLMICAWCRRYNEQIHALREIARRYASEDAKLPDSLTTSLTPEARQRLKEALAGKVE